jgi:DNA-directed RNA polymerase subunit RPC12/RpoP
MFILYTIVDNCNHCSPVNTSSIADGIFNSLNKVLLYYYYIACKYCNKRSLEKQVPTSPEELPF